MAKGGKREGAGRKKGGKNKDTLERERVEYAYKQRILKHADKILNAQLALAFGSYELFIIEHYEDNNGKVKKRHVRVEDPETMAAILDDPDMQQGDNYVMVKKVEADKYTLDALTDRAFGKPKQSVEQTNINLTPQDVISKLDENTKE